MSDDEKDLKEGGEESATTAPISDAVLEAFDPLDTDVSEEALETSDDEEGDLDEMLAGDYDRF